MRKREQPCSWCGVPHSGGPENCEKTIRRVKKEPAVLLPRARSDCKEFFEKTKVLTERRPHHQFLVFVVSANAVTVEIVDAARKLVDFPPECKVMVQWPGQWRSDWFKTTVGELVAARRPSGD